MTDDDRENLDLGFGYVSDAFEDPSRVDFDKLETGLFFLRDAAESGTVESLRVRAALGRVYCALADLAEIAKEEGL